MNELLAIWGFVDDATFLTKAGHVGVVYRVHGVDYEGLTHSQRQALVHRLEGGLRLLDERCRVYQYLLKQTIEPVVSAPCQQPIAHAAIQRRAAHLNARRHELYDIQLYLVLLYEPPDVVRRATRLQGALEESRKCPADPGSRRNARSICSKVKSIGQSTRFNTRRSRSRSR